MIIFFELRILPKTKHCWHRIDNGNQNENNMWEFTNCSTDFGDMCLNNKDKVTHTVLMGIPIYFL